MDAELSSRARGLPGERHGGNYYIKRERRKGEEKS